MRYHGEAPSDATCLAEDDAAVERPAVLIVDDHPSNLLALEAVLERLPVRIVRARSGEEALVKSAEQEFAVVLLDWRMPRLDGVETARRMRERDAQRQPPVLILTAHLPDLNEIKMAYAAGVVDFLQKPYAAEVLSAKVSVFVELLVQREKLRLYERALRKRFEQDLVGIVSHDLRSPLNAISLAAESALRRGDTNERTQRSLQIIQSAAGRATRLVHDLLDYTQVLQGAGLPLKREKFCLLTLAQEIGEELRASFPSAELSFEGEGETAGDWDRDRVAQVLTNLIGNASTYGGGAPVGVRIIGRESEVCLLVHNGGEPIAAELIPEVFEPLRRGTENRSAGNIGLGLFIVNEIVRAHGGTVTVQSSFDHGTTFSVSLPRVAATAARALAEEPLESAGRSGDRDARGEPEPRHSYLPVGQSGPDGNAMRHTASN
jgi:signal transduction histidine kinase